METVQDNLLMFSLCALVVAFAIILCIDWDHKRKERK